jgi:hypothetical protein
MTRFQYIAGFTFIGWGLMLITPLYLHFKMPDALVIVPIIGLFLITGITIMMNKKLSWTLGLIVGLVLVAHFALSMLNEIFRETDMVRRYEAPQIIIVVVWSLLTLSTLYSVIRFLSKNIRMKMNIGSTQFRGTLTVSVLLVSWVTYFLASQWYWF